MTNLLTLRRAFAINRVLIKHGLDEFLAPTPLSRLSGLMRLFALSRRRGNDIERGQRLKQALTELGPIFVKLGQMLSTRRDLLPPDLAEALAELQDKVAPFDGQQAQAIIEQQLGQPVAEIFSHFDSTPLASASVAQVHAATLKNGEQVVVKIIRPGIRRQIDADLKLLHLLADWAERYSSEARRLRPKQVVADYEHTLLAELDLRIEAANTSQLRHNFEHSELLYIPRVYWELTRKRVMVQERIGGIPIGDIDALRAAGTDMKRLAHRGVEIFFTQVFRDSFFHADMHPGNIFVDVSDPKKPKYIGIDCGIMGTLSEVDKRYLAQNFIAFFNRDYREIARLHVESGWVRKDVSIESFESAIRTACEPVFGKPLDEISFGHFLIQLFQTARRFDMEVQPQLVLLQKTLLYIEGLGRQLYPKLDLWQTAQPFLEEWMEKTYSLRAMVNKTRKRAPHWLAQLPDVPEQVLTLLHQYSSPRPQNNELVNALEKLGESQTQLGRRLRWAAMGLGLILLADSPILHQLELTHSSVLTLVLSGVCFVLSFRK